MNVVDSGRGVGTHSVAAHGPPCALPGSDVVPVTTEFYIDFPIVPCYDPGPHCILLDPIEAVTKVGCAETRPTAQMSEAIAIETR